MAIITGDKTMKKRIAFMITGLMLISGAAAIADNEWGLFGTFWSPSDGDDSAGGGVKVGIEMVDSVQLDLRWSVFSDVLDSPPGGPELEVRPLEFGLAFAVPVSDDVETAFGGGLGYYMMDGESGTGVDADVDSELGFYLSAGLEWTIQRSGADYGETSVKLFVEGIYRFVEADNILPTATPGVLADADLDGPGIQLGMLIAW